MARYDFLGQLRALVRHDVRFIVVGGVASVAHGSPSVTKDLDICYERTPGNLERLAEALRSLNATPRGVDDEGPFVLDARTLERGDHFTFSTDAGPLDCLATPAGSRGFDGLLGNAVPVDLDGIQVLIAGIDDLIRMKRAAGRPQDLQEVEILGALREELEGHGEG